MFRQLLLPAAPMPNAALMDLLGILSAKGTMSTEAIKHILVITLAQPRALALILQPINYRLTAQQIKHALAELATMLTLPAILTLIVAPTDS